MVVMLVVNILLKVFLDGPQEVVAVVVPPRDISDQNT